MPIFTAKPLGDGQLPTTKGTLYTVPASTTAYVKRVAFFNTNATEQTILVYLNLSGVSRLWRRYVLAQNESADLLEHGDALLLAAGDLLEAQTTTGSAVDYIVMGIEEVPD
jgi:hypothetical protein